MSGDQPDTAPKAGGETSPLRVRNKDGLLEALPEGDLGVSRAADFMADTSDEAQGASSSISIFLQDVAS